MNPELASIKALISGLMIFNPVFVLDYEYI
jgi:hypothetical protein